MQLYDQLKLRDDEDIAVRRRESVHGTFSLISAMRVERGTKDDWEELHALHYKSEGKAMGRVWRCMLGDQLVGVLIISSPRLLLAPRHDLFPRLKPGKDTKLTNVYRAKYINANFGLCSRIVVDTLFRACGVSYRFLNLVARMEKRRYMEIQSSMSRFNPFAIKAGFYFAKPREAAAYEKGLKFMTRLLKSHPADHEAIMEELVAMKPAIRERTLQELRMFYYKHSALEKTGANLNAGMGRVESMEPKELVRQLQQLVFSSPMYGVYQNPDEGDTVPQVLPLSAFDNQDTKTPLRLDLL